VAIYEYQCDQDGTLEVIRPIGTAPQSIDCPVCGVAARRIISVPSVRSGSRTAWTAALDHANKSRYEPEVVSSLPPSGALRRTVQMTPALRRLPRQ
jgi:putative FmdB family regulatory protein